MKLNATLGSLTSGRSLVVLIFLAALAVTIPNVGASGGADIGVQPNAIGMHVFGTLTPGQIQYWGGIYELAGAPVQVFISWQPTNAPIWIGFYCADTGYIKVWKITGGSWSGILFVYQTGMNYFVVWNRNPSTTITYSGEVVWP